jgi:hypothetical protein
MGRLVRLGIIARHAGKATATTAGLATQTGIGACAALLIPTVETGHALETGFAAAVEADRLPGRARRRGRVWLLLAALAPFPSFLPFRVGERRYRESTESECAGKHPTRNRRAEGPGQVIESLGVHRRLLTDVNSQRNPIAVG